MEWYYAENGQQFGPVSQDELFSFVAAGRLGPGSLVWQEGMASWMPLGNLDPSSGISFPYLAQSQGFNMMNPVTSGLAIASLVCGVVSVISCMVFLGIPAVICGHMAMNQIANSRTMVIGRGLAISGLVCGYLSLVMLISGICLFIFVMASSP